MRVFLFLLLTTTAAARPIQCVSDEYGPVSAWVRYDSPYALVRIPRPVVKGMTRARIGDVTIYTGREKGEYDIRLLHVIAERDGAWFQLHDEQGLPMIGTGWPRPETEAAPVVERAKAGLPIVRVTWISQWMGANRAGLTRMTLLLDVRAEPRVLVAIDCSDAGGGGACSAPDAAHYPRDEMTCDEELRCTTRQSLWLDWTRRFATRRFDLLTNETLPPRRFDAVRYASGAAFAAAAPESIRQRALIDGIGIVQPVHEVSSGVVLFAAHTREPVVGFRFFLVDRGAWREVPVTLLTDAGYPGPDAALERAGSIAPDFTPDAPQLVFSADAFRLPRRRRLIVVTATEGAARSIFWILLDPGGRAGALRVATDHPEWRHCGNVVYPITATSVVFSESGLPAFVEGIASWRADDLREQRLPRTCNLVGTIDWSAKRGWIVRLGQAPCTDPLVRPFAAVIDDDGRIGVRRVELSER